MAGRRAFITLAARFVFTAAAGMAYAGHGAGAVDDYPHRPVRFIVPLAPGGGSDIVARMLAFPLNEHWKQSVVVDNRPGAGSALGTAIAAKAPSDGYTLLVSSSSIAITPALSHESGLDVLRDFAPISLIASQPSIVAVHPSVNADSLSALISLLKSRPGYFRYGSAGPGTASHLANELFSARAGVTVTHIPYKSAGLATTALLSGEVHLMVTNTATILPQVRAAKVKALAVTSARRSALAPELPTVAEAGIPAFEYSTWYGVLAPARTPRNLVSRIHRDVAYVSSIPAVRERFASQGLELHASAPPDFAAYLAREVTTWKEVVRKANIKAE